MSQEKYANAETYQLTITKGQEPSQTVFGDEKVKFSLSGSGLKNINLNEFEKNFSFIFKNATFKCNAILAEFLSPLVSNIRRADSSITAVFLDYKIKDQKQTFNFLNSILAGDEIELLDTNGGPEIYDVLLVLGNNEILSTPPFTNITNDNVLSLLEKKRYHKANYQEEIDYCAKHFEILKDMFIKQHHVLTPDDLILIASSNQLQLNDEYSLLEFIKTAMEWSQDNSMMLKSIKFKCLKENEKQEYIELARNTNDAKLYTELFPTLSNDCEVNPDRYLSQEARRKIENEIAEKKKREAEIAKLKNQTSSAGSQTSNASYSKTFDYTGNMWNGVFYYLMQNYGSGNASRLLSSGKIQIESSIVYSGNNYYIIENSSNCFSTQSYKPAYFLFDFKNMKIILSKLSFYTDCSWTYCPTAFIVEGSNDRAKWEKLATIYTGFTSQNQQKIFDINATYSYQYILMRLKNRNSNNGWYFATRQVEFFGTLESNESI